MTIRRWHKHFKTFGEVPCITRQWSLKFLRLAGVRYIRSRAFQPEHFVALEQILKEHPEYYLDEFVDELHARTKVWFHPSTMWRALHDKLGYRLKVITETAKNRGKGL